jgi:hypothetical protein
MTDYWDEFYQSYDLRTSNAPEAVRIMMQARDRAALAGNNEAVLYMNHWILQTLINRVQDYKTAYDLSVKAAIEARKPQYAHMQEHICAQQDLILSYLGMDPEGHEALIDDAIRFMASEISGRPIQCRFCLQEIRCSFEVARGQIDEALAECNHYLSMADEPGNPHRRHHRTVALHSLCDAAYRKGDWTLLLNSASQGEILAANDSTFAQTNCFFAGCQALARLKLGEVDQAQQMYRRALSLAAALPGNTMVFGYYDVMCMYNEHIGDIDAALHLRDLQLAEVVNKSQLFWEARVRLERIRLLKALGQPIAEAAADTRPVIGQLKRGDKLLAELDRLVGT